MTTPEAYFESSYLIDAEIGVPIKHLDLSNEYNCDINQDAKLLLDELRERLGCAEGVKFEMSQELKQRLIDQLSNQ